MTWLFAIVICAICALFIAANYYDERDWDALVFPDDERGHALRESEQRSIL